MVSVNETASGTTNYTYRPNGMRQAKIGAVITTHVWDGANIVADIEGSSVTTYLRGVNLIASVKGSAKNYYLYNAHGDVVLFGSRAYKYDAFGNELATNANDVNPFRYAGEYWDGETGTYYLRARIYNPGNGRFLTEDPIRNGLNWYTYCIGNPILLVDPSGLIEVELRAYAESFGAKVSWDEATRMATIVYHGITASYSSKINSNGRMVIDDSILNQRFGFSMNPISIVKDGDITVISAFVSISGLGADDSIGESSTTYRQQALTGIRKNWGGSGSRVYIIDLNDGRTHTVPTGQKSLSITINQGLGIPNMPGGSWESYSDPGEIILYQGDSRGDGSLYTTSSYGWVSAHEFGHAMGVGDVYSVSGLTGMSSIMNSFGTQAQQIDIAMVWEAYNSNSWQDWSKTIPD